MRTIRHQPEQEPTSPEHIFFHPGCRLDRDEKITFTKEAKDELKHYLEALQKTIPEVPAHSLPLQESTANAIADVMIHAGKKSSKLHTFFDRLRQEKPKDQKKLEHTVEKYTPETYWLAYIACIPEGQTQSTTLPVPLIIRKGLKYSDMIESLEKRLALYRSHKK